MVHSESQEPDSITETFWNCRIRIRLLKKIRIRKTLNAGASICREQGEADQLRHRQPHLQGGRSGRHQRP
jgi:hypothetical protein